MKCKHCGEQIPKGYVYCVKCGREVQMVPDYNPLDDVITAEVKDSFTQQGNAKSQNPNLGLKQRKEMHRQEQRFQEKNHQKKQKHKRMKYQVISVAVLVALGVLIAFFLYRQSYNGIVSQGKSYYRKGNEKKAEELFQKAIQKDSTMLLAYKELEKVYLGQHQKEKIEKMYLKAIKDNTSQVSLYQALIHFYKDTNQMDRISKLLEDCHDESVLEELGQYISKGPSFSLKEGTYDDVQELSLSSQGKEIYYTLDNTEPTIHSKRFKEPILLKEGTTKVRAISVNEEGVPSSEVHKTYVISFPVAEAPSVSPSTGQYDHPMQITILVPEGYTAYYTITEASAPTIPLPNETSSVYVGPVDMPEGNNIFCAVLIDQKGRKSEVKKMNYELHLQ